MLRLFSFFTLMSLSSAALAQEATTVIHAGRVITEAGMPALGPSTITIRDGRIVSVSEGIVPPEAGAEFVDLSNRTLLPGLIETHSHLAGDPGGDYRNEAVDSDEWGVVIGVRNMATTARAGFTTVRVPGIGNDVGAALRRATAEGSLPGPRILSSGHGLSIIGGHGDVSGFREDVNAVLDGHNTCTGPTECAARVREAGRRGSDFIKITATGGVLSQQARGLDQHFTDEEMRAIVSTAHGLGMHVAAHAHGARGIEAAARAGVDSIEHGTFADDAALAAMRENGTVFVPTLMAYTGIRERLGTGVYTAQVEQKIRETLAVVGQAARRAHERGITVVFGTDAGVFEHGRNAEELAMYVDILGMTPAEVLRSATVDAAELVGMEGEIGRLAPGYSADLIAVSGDPQADIAVLGDVGYVMVRGRPIE
ncbi:metal-dependent hydrolase family protein [Parasphingopyxis lamellibrachiae]|uniref:Imidazolonepropionase-like amidohydrolase n=1 Tax=Parasphingopyxis lamellibrachiae TaxID=680125 RepID=A0A3D9FI21_9SPHN|nr:amidohydrolase family protein [Parasphingopyxis lamellibrachiae]RED17425.1 imidazolonepropionase-like amidohydrolase [Parasphingopyxis lamellibrachiae]